MKFTIRELVETIIMAQIPDVAKTDLLTRVITSATITDGLYLKRDEQGLLECWYKNKDESGTMEHGPTGYDAERVVNEYLYALGQKSEKGPGKK